MARRLEPRPAAAATATAAATTPPPVSSTSPHAPPDPNAVAAAPGTPTTTLPSDTKTCASALPPELHHKPAKQKSAHLYHTKLHDRDFDRDRDRDRDRDYVAASAKKARASTQQQPPGAGPPAGAGGPRASPFRRWPHALFCAASIMLSLMAYSILQERIMTRPYTIPARGVPALLPAATARRRLGGDGLRDGGLLDDGDVDDDGDDGEGDDATGAARLRFGLGLGLGLRTSPRARSYNSSLGVADSDALPRRTRRDAVGGGGGGGGGARTAFFSNSLFLVLVNRLFAAAVALGCILYRKERDDLKSSAPLLDYASISLSNVIATSCQYEALKWLTFPTVTIGKCAKMLPVMIILNVRSGRQYSVDDFGIVGVVLAGCGLMISSGNVMAKRGGSAEADTPFGFVLMLVYLLFDAITSTYQERLFTKYDMSVYNQMLYMNVTSAAMSFGALGVSGGLLSSLRFVAAFPTVLRDIVMLSMSAVGGQFAITYTIQSFGALLYAGIMTTRQFFSVLASDVIFKHGLNKMQWTGALMVFSALFYKLYRKAVQSTA